MRIKIMNEQLLFSMRVLPYIFEWIHCFFASYWALKIFQNNCIFSATFYGRFLSWALFISFACIPIVIIFGIYNEHNILILLANLSIMFLMLVNNRNSLLKGGVKRQIIQKDIE